MYSHSCLDKKSINTKSLYQLTLRWFVSDQGTNNRVRQNKRTEICVNIPQSFVEILKTRANVTIDNVKKSPESHQGHTLYLALPYRVGRAFSYL